MIGNLDPKGFEQFVARIHSLLEGEGALLTWNASLPDPDSPKNPRQIDILVEWDGRKTHIECRYRKAPQGSNWIEELYGRKASLNVDSIIGVSASGFTGPAIVKANRLGVILKDLNEITEQEIKSWGRFTTVYGHYVRLLMPKIDVFFDPAMPKIDLSEKKLIDLLEEKKIFTNLLSTFSHKCYEKAQQENLEVGAVSPVVGYNLYFYEPLEIGRNHLNLIQVRTRFQVVTATMTVAYAGLYGSPAATPNDRQILAQRFSFPGWEVNRSKSKTHLSLDVGSIPHPEDCVLVKIEFKNLSHIGKRVNKIHASGYENFKAVHNINCDVDILYEEVHKPDSADEHKLFLPTIDLGGSSDA